MKYYFIILGLLLTACSKNPQETLQGYVEIEPVYLAAGVSGYLQQLSVQRGDNVKAGQGLFALDSDLQQAQISGVKAQLIHAQASAKQAKAELDRQEKLWRQHLISDNQIDEVRTRYATTQADVDMQVAQQTQQKWHLNQRGHAAPVNARVEQTFYRVGEWVPAGSPIVELLDPQAIKIRFYVPETQLKKYAVSQKITVTCDGCQPMSAIVNYQSRQAEFTPPVIYSQGNREKLVYLVEAKPLNASALNPGQPVDVTIAHD